MKKGYRRIAMVSACALVVGCAVNTQAGTFVNGGTAGTDIATEIFGSGSATTLLPTTATATAVYTLAAAPGGGAAFNIDYTLSDGATFGIALTGASCAYAGSGAVTIALVEGGGTTDSTAKFRVDVTTALTADETFTLTYNAANVDHLGTSGATQEIGVALSDTLGVVDTAGSVTVFTGDAGTDNIITASSTSTDLFIDVVESSTKFAGAIAGDVISDQEVILGSLDISDSGALEDDSATAWVAGAGDAGNTTVITLTGNFAASLAVDSDVDPTTADGVYWDLNGTGTYNVGEEADTLSATSASWTIVNQADTAGPLNFHMKVDGTTGIETGAASVSVTQTWVGTNYAPTTTTGTLRNLQKNGDTDIANFALTPGGVYNNYVRISNTSGVTGDVYIKVYQDDGTASTTFTLSDVNASYSDTVAAQGSSEQMTIQEIYDASGLAAGYTGKLRVEVNGDFPSIDIQVYTVSLDGNNFSTF